MSDPDRPDPDALLARVKQQEQDERGSGKRGRLKIFFGASAGVGKTYAMLSEAQTLLAAGTDVVGGYVETHKRKETEELLDGIPLLPLREIAYRGVTLREFDLDAALARRPAILLLDELAHTNVEGSRHAKRWQDAIELLDAGINVYTTVNVQHIESLNDVVAQITGVIVRETVPDFVIAQADEIELIDLSPEELQQRLKEGKVYVADQASRAANSFFRKGNLMALRELALRRTAERVDAQMQRYKEEHEIERIWPAGERFLVCIGPGLLAPRIVRRAARMAQAMRSEWVVAFVETPSGRMKDADRERIAESLRLAEKLGAQTVTLQGDNAADELLNYARSRNIGRIVIGKPLHARWKELLFGSVLDDLITRSGEIDVFVVSGDDEEGSPAPLTFQSASLRDWRTYAAPVVGAIVSFGIAYLFDPLLGTTNLAMIFVLGVVIVASLFGRSAAIAASILNVLIFDFFFVPPQLTFVVDDTQYIITFAVMLIVGVAIATLSGRLRQQIVAARQRERRTASLYAFSRDLANARTREAVAHTTTRHVSDVFEGKSVVLTPAAKDALAADAEPTAGFVLNDAECGVAQWTFDHAKPAGLSTDTLPGAEAIYLPLTGSGGVAGVLGVKPSNPKRFADPEQMHLLETFANQTALAVERTLLADEAEAARVHAETEQLRNTLLSSISHDLRTPLTSITGAASILLDADAALADGQRRDLAESIYDEAERLNNLVRNLLDMSKLESGAMTLNKEPQALEEIVGYVLDRMERQLHGHSIKVALPAGLPLAPMDGVLVAQVLVNLLENAAKYTPPGTMIEIGAVHDTTNNVVRVSVADDGPGLPKGEEARVFEKFHRAANGVAAGSGLGLAICRAIVNAHGGRIWAENRPGPQGGAVFTFTLPLAA